MSFRLKLTLRCALPVLLGLALVIFAGCGAGRSAGGSPATGDAAGMPAIEGSAADSGRLMGGEMVYLADASLVNTYWRITRFGEQPVSAVDGRREPHLLLREHGGKQTFAATVGCNQLLGSYTVTGERITFAAGATTMMACPPPLDALERRMIDTLVRTRRWQIHANTLAFEDEAGNRIALFEAVQF